MEGVQSLKPTINNRGAKGRGRFFQSRCFDKFPNMSDSDQFDSGDETTGPNMALSGLHLNSIKETYGNQHSKATGGASGFKAASENSQNSHSASSFWGQTNTQNNEVEKSAGSGGWCPDTRNDDRNGRGGGGGGGGGGDRPCFNCEGFGHMSRECPEPRKPPTCHSCKEVGHVARSCPNGDGNTRGYQGNRDGGSSTRGFGGNRGGGSSSRGFGGNSGGGLCYKCQQPGHMANNCLNDVASKGTISSDYNNGTNSGDNQYGQNNRQERQGGRACFKCHEEGHMSRDCPSGGGGGYGGRTNDRNNGDSSNSRGCFKCKEEGHRSFECPNEPVGDNSRNGGKSGCFKCGDSSHMAKDCTKTDEELKSMGIEVKPPPVTYIPVEIEDDDLFGQGVSVGNNFSAYANIPVQVSGKDVPKAISSFSSAGLRKMLLENVEKAHYNVPTPIQKTAIPIIMNGRDIMGCAQTGSGKTAAYLLPILHYILENNIESFAYEQPMKLTALILAPTRELAIQIYNEARKFAAGSILKICITYGGVSVSYQHKKFQEGCHVLVATPGRLMDFLNKDRLTFAALKFLVLDEADRMLDLGFSEDVRKIIAHSSTPVKEERQTLMFSATFSEEVQNLAKDFLNNYVYVVIGIVGAANADVKQTIMEIEAKDKRETLRQFLKDTLQKNEKEKILVFVSTKRMADFLAAYLCQQEISTTSIHGDRFQNQREEALSEFKNGIRNVLIATAVAARGLDIKGVGYVVNVDLPSDIDEYVHRIGRTGRVGNQGNAISYFDPSKDSIIAANLVKILSDAEQETPEWLLEFTGGGTGGRGKALFGASKDIRKGHGFVSHDTEYSSAAHLGGPSKDTDEEMWD